MNKLIVLFAVILAMSVCSASVTMADSAKGKNSSQGQLHIENHPSLLDEEAMPCYFDIQWQQWTLIGEPVFNTKIVWGINDHLGTFHFKDRNGKSVTLSPSTIPLEVLQKIFIVDLDFDGRVDQNAVRSAGLSAREKVYFKIGSGVPGKPTVQHFSARETLPGTENFNVPGSPNWDRVFYTYSGDERTYLPPEQAKQIVTHGFEAVEVFSRVSRLEASLFSVKAWYNSRLDEQELKKLKQKQQHESKKLAASYQLQERRNKEAQSRQDTGQDDFLAELDDQLSQIDLDKERQRATERLAAKQRQEIAALEKSSQEYQNELDRQKKRDALKLQAKRTEVARRTLPTEKLLVFADRNEDYGYKDSKGNIVIPAQYDSASSFYGDYASVCTGEHKCGIIDKKGTVIIPMDYDYSKVVGPDLFVLEKGKEGLFDRNLNEILPFRYSRIKAFGGNHVAVRELSSDYANFALADSSGTFLTDYDYDTFSTYEFGDEDFGGQYAAVCTAYNSYHPENNRCGIIDEQGKTVVPFDYKYTKVVGPGLFAVRNGSYYYGVLDSNLKQIFPFKFYDIEPLGDSHITLRNTDEKYALADHQGHVLTGFDFSELELFSEGYIRFQIESKKGRKMGLLSTATGKVAVPAKFYAIRALDQDRAEATISIHTKGHCSAYRVYTESVVIDMHGTQLEAPKTTLTRTGELCLNRE